MRFLVITDLHQKRPDVGWINEEIAALMARYRLNKGSVSTWPLSSWLSDPYYDGKLLLSIE